MKYLVAQKIHNQVSRVLKFSTGTRRLVKIGNFMTFILSEIVFCTLLGFPSYIASFRSVKLLAAETTIIKVFKVLKFSTGSSLVKIGNF